MVLELEPAELALCGSSIMVAGIVARGSVHVVVLVSKPRARLLNEASQWESPASRPVIFTCMLPGYLAVKLVNIIQQAPLTKLTSLITEPNRMCDEYYINF